MRLLSVVDPELAALVDAELVRQCETLSLIAAENSVSQALMEVAGSVLTNKVVEGYPGRRYHAGCEVIDAIERLAVERAKSLYGAEHANVQPHSGSSANLAVYAAVLRPGDRILAMDLAHGGHLSHGAPAHVTSQYYEAHSYTVRRDTETVDFDMVRAKAKELRPRLIIAGCSAYPRAMEYRPFREIADSVGSLFMVDMAHIAGLVAAGVHPSPVPHADFVTATCYKTLRGAKGGFVLSRGEHARKIDGAMFPGTQGSVNVAAVGAKALTFQDAGTPRFRQYAGQVVANARALAEKLRERGFRLVAGGTDTHQVLVHLEGRDIAGRDAELVLSRAGILVNKNLVPFDTRGPRVTSGLRLGTAGLTSRGFSEVEMSEVAAILADVLDRPVSDATLDGARRRVQDLCRRFPLYGDRWEEPVTPRS